MSILEVTMLVCFGISWPFSIRKSYVSRTAKGKSVVFLICLIIGYAAGILNKFLIRYDNAVVFYIINLVMVCIDTSLYFRNCKLDKLTEAQNKG